MSNFSEKLMNTSISSVEQLKDFIITCLEDKKAMDIVVLDVEQRIQLTKYMIFASGRSTKNIAAIADYVALEVKHKTNLNVSIEGIGNSEWVLVDIGDIIVHVFYPAAREYLKLEDKWNEC